MSDSQPVAATLREIKAAFPKASADFVVKCLEKSLPMASVASAAVEEMMAENEQLKAKITAMEEEMAKSKAEGDVMPAEEDEEEVEKEVGASAKARGVKPVAKAKASGPSAKSRWEAAIESCLATCKGNKVAAVAMANRTNPGLRTQMLEEVNA